MDGGKRDSEKRYYYWLRKARREVFGQFHASNASLPAMQEKEA